MCLYPKLIKNRKYMANKKNGGNVPPVYDDRVLYVPVGCQNCMECRKQKAREWQVRLLEDIKHNKNGRFITLTFTHESYAKLAGEIENASGYTLDNAIATKGVRLFLERWRKKYKKSLRHWLITEIGHNGTENIHLHGIVWTDIDLNELERIWGYGFVWKGKHRYVVNNGKKVPIIENYVNAKTVTYITKYVTKVDEKHKTFKGIILTSPGIGGDYTKGKLGDWRQNQFKGKQTVETYRTSTGHKMAMPVYWRNKIYTEEEREKLWLMKLDKMERYVCGEKVDVSQSDKAYTELLEWYRKINRQLGYGDDVKNWEQELYESQQRMIKQLTRIKKAKK